MDTNSTAVGPERDALLNRKSNRPTYGSNASRSSLQDIGAVDVSASVVSVEPNEFDDVNAISFLQASGIVLSLGLLIFLQATNISMLTTIQGVIAEELDAFESTIWFTSAYLIGMASISPVTGRLSYIITPRIVLFLSTLILTLGSLVSGLAPSLTIFLAGRVISGTGAAGVLSIGLILVIELTSAKRKGLWVGILNSGFTVGVAFGAVFAGLFEPIFGWRALFWIQAPLSILGGVGLLVSIPSTMRKQELDANNTRDSQSTWQRLAGVDYIGAALLIGTLTFLLYGLAGSSISWPSIAVAFSLLPVFLLQETYRHPDPIIPVSVLESRPVLLSNISTLGFMMARWAVLFYSPVYATAVREWSPATAGSLLVPTNVGFILGGVLSGGLHIRGNRSWWTASIVVFALFSLSLIALAVEATRDSSTWVVVLWIFFNGLLAGGSLNYTLNHLLYLVKPDVSFIATSLVATFRGFAGTLGSAVGGGIFIRVLRQSLQSGFEQHGYNKHDDLIRKLIGSPRAVQSLKGVQHDIAVEAYTKAIQTLFFTGAGISLVMLLAQAGTGWTAPATEQSTLLSYDDHDIDEVTDGQT